MTLTMIAYEVMLKQLLECARLLSEELILKMIHPSLASWTLIIVLRQISEELF